jgi:predicted Zn-dependent peptidase
VSDNLVIKDLPNGMTCIIDEMPQVQSAAYSLLLHGGTIHDTLERAGEALILSEMFGKGAGPYDARELLNQYDTLGISHGEYASMTSFGFSGSCVKEQLSKALELLKLQVRNPHLPEESFESCRSLLLQDVESLHDSPSRWCMHEFNQRYFPEPWNRSSIGTIEGLNSCNILGIKERFAKLAPEKGVLSIAGGVSAQELLPLITKLFGDWHGKSPIIPHFPKLPEFNRYHIFSDSAQTQLTLGFPSAKFGDKYYYEARLANEILSGGSFGRLYVEVREKKGLCYSVYSSHSSTQLYGATIVYAGTTPERVVETLATIKTEFERLAFTITEQELKRAKANMKASVILSDDSSRARASSNAGDYWLGGRVRSTEEVSHKIDEVTISRIGEYLKAYPVTPATLIVLGKEDIQEII